VVFPTGGDSPRAKAGLGEIPKPTVKVWMIEGLSTKQMPIFRAFFYCKGV